MKLTAAQAAALRFAEREPIQYYKGGWYTTPELGGADQYHPKLIFEIISVDCGTLAALTNRGLLTQSRIDDGSGGIYGMRWTITDAGRNALRGKAILIDAATRATPAVESALRRQGHSPRWSGRPYIESLDTHAEVYARRDGACRRCRWNFHFIVRNTDSAVAYGAIQIRCGASGGGQLIKGTSVQIPAKTKRVQKG